VASQKGKKTENGEGGGKDKTSRKNLALFDMFAK
jgi:hypothetical protein